MRILIAEDDFTSRNILTAVLQKNGYEPVVTVNGRNALESLQNPDSPQLVILDWMMPDMDGFEVLRRVRAKSTDRPPYIIMLTSRADKAEIIAALDAGANDYLTKPFDPDELRARVAVGHRMVKIQDELVSSREDLAHQANHDPLTGLPNRRSILDRLHKELARACRHSDVLSVGICDVDHFKSVNDTYGHQAGDDVLCALSQILTRCCRVYDSVGRMGGEEFVIIAPMKSDTNPSALYQRIRKAISETTMTTRAGALSITVSIGFAAATADDTADALLSAADAALYRAKAEGRNRVIFLDKRN